MNPTHRTLVRMSIAALSLAFPLLAGAGEATKQAPAGGTPEMPPQFAQAMARMEAYGALNEHHAYLKQFEGEWECNMKWWMSAEMPPIENTVSCSAKLGFGGHFLTETYSGKVTMGPGTPPEEFQGRSTMGYDNHRKQYVSTWIDNWGSGMMTEFGSASQNGKVFNFEGENYCCMTDKICQSKSTITIVDADTRTMEMWGPGLDGKVIKTMSITLKRKK